MKDVKKSNLETVEEILKNTFDEIIETSGLPKALIAGAFFGFGVVCVCRTIGVLSAINMMGAQIAKLSEALLYMSLKGDEGKEDA